MKKKDLKGPAISAAIGATFFAVPFCFLNVALLPSIGIAAAAFGAGNLLFSGSDKEEVIGEDDSLSFDGKIKKARSQADKLYAMKSRVEDDELIANIDEIRNTAIKIIDAVEKNPGKMDKLSTFFNYYLPVMVKIIEKYDEIENQRLDSEDSEKLLNHTKNIVKKLNVEFKKELGKLFEREIIDAEAEVKVLEKMLNSEGFDEIKLKK